MSKVEVDQVDPQSGTTLTLGTSGDTVSIPSGVTLANAGTVTGIPTSALTGTIATAQIADDAVTLAKMAPGTDGNVISYDASGNPVAVATGSAGQVLTSAGAGAPPTFAAAGGVTATAEFSAYVSSDITINNNSDTLITFQTELFDPDGVYNTSNGRFTAPSDGKYLLGSNIWSYDSNQDLQSQDIKLFINGSLKIQQVYSIRTDRNIKLDSHMSSILNLSQNDYVQIYINLVTYDTSSAVVEAASGIYQNNFYGFRLPT